MTWVCNHINRWIFKIIICIYLCRHTYTVLGAPQVELVVKNLPANARDIRDEGLIPRLGRSPGGRHDNTLQYSWLEPSMDRGAWWATVHRVTKNWTWLKWLSTHSTISFRSLQFSSVQFSSVAQSCPTLCGPMNCSTPGLPVHHQLPESTQTHVHWVGDAIQPSHPLSAPLLLPSIFSSIRVFSNESALRIR